MKTLSLTAAAEIKDAPTKAYLYRVVKREDRADYFIHDGDKWMVNIESPSWLELLRRRAIEGVTGKHTKKPDPVATVKTKPVGKTQKTDKKINDMADIDSGDDIADLKKRKLQEEVKGKTIANEIKYLEMQKQSGNIIDFDLAKYLFFSYMEKANIDFYRAARKNEAIIANFVKEGKVREIIQVVENECTAILKEIEKKQKEALDKWNEEEGRSK